MERINGSITVAGRGFEPGDLVIRRPWHPDPTRRLVVEVRLPPTAALALYARDDLRRELTQVAADANASCPEWWDELPC